MLFRQVHALQVLLHLKALVCQFEQPSCLLSEQGFSHVAAYCLISLLCHRRTEMTGIPLVQVTEVEPLQGNPILVSLLLALVLF